LALYLRLGASVNLLLVMNSGLGLKLTTEINELFDREHKPPHSDGMGRPYDRLITLGSSLLRRPKL
jgi:hypothetical protein